jgi:phosphinothricin acetyltransferase
MDSTTSCRPDTARAVTIRAASPDDAARLAEIWNREVLETLATTDTEPRDAAAQRAWLAQHSTPYPVVVAVAREHHAEVAGYAALTPYRPKPAFRHTVEDSIYVDRAWRGRGVGRRLLTHLLDVAAAAGHRSMLARITTGNAASRRLHEALGFRLVGVEEAVAFKLGCWLDVATYQKSLVSALHGTRAT